MSLLRIDWEQSKQGNFALFMRLNDPRFDDEKLHPEGKDKAISNVWAKIVQYKPDEIIGMYRGS